MIHQHFARPPATPKGLRRQREIINALVARSMIAYMLFGVAMAILARPAFAAFERGSIVTGALTVIGLMAIYALTGGILCVSFVAHLQNWPPPKPEFAIRGGHFVRTWLWSAPRILVQLGLGEHVRFAR